MAGKAWNVTGKLMGSPRMGRHDGSPVANFKLEVEQYHMDGETRVVDKPKVWGVSAWKELAEHVDLSELKKGTRIHVFGSYDESKDGSSSYVDHEMTAWDVSVSLREATVAVTPVQALEASGDSLAG